MTRSHSLKRLHELTSPFDVGYVGWNGRGNVGDDAIRAGHTKLWNVEMRDLPFGRLAALSGAAGVGRSWGGGRRPLLLLGGGTVVGRPEWLRRVVTADRLIAPSHRVALGVGVEDPSFNGRSSYVTPADLKAWAGYLSTFDIVGVRGPRSAEILHDFGLEVAVVGDPALVLRGDRRHQASAPLVALNVANAEDTYGGCSVPMSEMGTAVRLLLRAGYGCVLFTLAPGDVTACRMVADAAGVDLAIRDCRSVSDALDVVSKATIVISQRLHGCVLAAAAAVPTIALDYRPKCVDFMRSIGIEDWGIRLPELTADRIESAIGSASDQIGRMTDRVESLVGSLSANAERGRALLAGPLGY